MSEKPIEWCFLWLGPCLPSPEWASWAQAIFSALAVFAAIGVVWWQQHIARQNSKATARLVASGLLAFLSQSTGGLQSVASGLKERISGQENLSSAPKHLAAILGTLPLPSKEDLLAINSELPDCAIGLLRASNAAHQIKTALEFIATIGTNGASLSELCEPLYELARDAAETFKKAQLELDKFCPR